MKIAIIHSPYSATSPSGEDIIVREQVKVLNLAGHDTRLFEESIPENLHADPKLMLEKGFSVISGRGPSPISQFDDWTPDIIHIHNLFPNWWTNWIERLEIPFVVTIHNFRDFCASGSLLREGSFCRLCADKSQIYGVLNRCYRKSAVSTLPLAIRNSIPLSHRPVFANAKRIIALSDRSHALLESFGVDRHKLVRLDNFWSTPTPSPKASSKQINGFVYAGYLSKAKGINLLAKNWPVEEKLSIFGSGPESTELAPYLSANVSLHGAVPLPTIIEALEHSESLIFPSLMVENGPTIQLQALSVGTPTIALRGSAAADLISRYGCGEVIDAVHPEILRSAVAKIRSAGAKLRQNCIETFSANFSETVWTSKLLGLYNEAIKR